MIEERAIVSNVADGRVWVDTDRRSGCELCESGQGCGGGILGKLVGYRASTLPVLSDVDGLVAGDAVIVSIAEDAIVKASVAAYLVPLAFMFAFALVATFLLGASDLVVALFGASGLAAGFLWLAGFSSRVRLTPNWQPRIVRRAATAPSACHITTATPQS